MARTLVPLKRVPEHRPWVSERWLRRAVFERRIPYHKLGGGRGSPVLIDLADLDALVEAGRVTPSGGDARAGDRR